MIKKFCDCCNKNITKHGTGRKFSYGVHLDRLNDGRGHSDLEMNPVSGREEAWEVCNRCYNRVMILAVNEFHKIRDAKIRDKVIILEEDE